MKPKIKHRIAITFICVVAGIILSMQYKTNKTLSAVNIPVHRSKEIAAEYSKLKEEREQLKRQINSLEQKIKVYESENSTEDEFLQTLYSEIDKYKTLSGYEALKGRGVTIKINDAAVQVIENQNQSFVVQHYDTIVEIINVLNAAEAEAISINDQRYTSFTEIVPAGNHIEINGVSNGAPFIIKALGNPEDLENSLRIKGGVVWLMEQKYNIEVEIVQEEEIYIPKYTKNREYIYSEPTEG